MENITPYSSRNPTFFEQLYTSLKIVINLAPFAPSDTYESSIRGPCSIVTQMAWLTKTFQVGGIMRGVRLFLAYFIFVYAWVVYQTVRWRFIDPENRDKALEHGRVIYTFWHTNIVGWYCSVRFEDPTNIVNLTLGGKTGEILGPLSRAYGCKPVFTCPDDDVRKNATAVAKVIRDIKRGMNSFIAPDGPEGPAYQVKTGIATITRKIDGVILPMAVLPKWHFRLWRWDRAIIPLPFSKMTVTYGEPIFAGRYSAADEVLEKIEGNLNACLNGYSVRD